MRDDTPLPQAAAHTPVLRRLRAQVFAILHEPDPGNRLAKWLNWLLAALIVGNAIAITLETVPGISRDFARTLHAFEAVSTGIFIVEYLARVWTCVEQQRLRHPLWGRLRFMTQPLAVLDLIAIVTWWTPWDLRFVRVVRLVRLLKVFHLYEFEAALERLSVSLERRKELLLVAVVLMAVFVYLASSLLYQIEHARQPRVFSSIPATFWWAMVTFNTIGYGDMVPLTPAGQLVAALVSVFGVGIFALPTAIVIAAIIESSASGTAYVCHACGHHGVTSHTHHKAT
ncbi:MAG TPA: ion transporter [Burkholderiaceae bacterium]|nr:ion transporter [Burkholderiaceae bacterium]